MAEASNSVGESQQQNNMDSTPQSYASAVKDNNQIPNNQKPRQTRNDYRTEEVTVERPNTQTFGSKDGKIPLDIVLNYFDTIGIINDIECINNLSKSEQETVYEMSFKDMVGEKIKREQVEEIR